MAALLAAGAVALGGAISAFGASSNAKALKKAQKRIRREEEAFSQKWTSALEDDIAQREQKLYNLGDIFDRFESTGAFGDTETAENLRKAQEDFSALAAGDFTGFESQLRKTLSDQLINTVGAGSPVGAYAGLAADTMLNYRLQGINTSASLSEFFANQAANLLGMEFGIMDTRFDKGYNIDRNRQTAVNAARLGQAQTAGIGLQAAGGAIQQTGSGMFRAMQYNQDQRNIDNSFALQMARLQQPQDTQRPEVQTPALNALSSPAYSYNSTPTFNSTSYLNPTLPELLPELLPDSIDIGDTSMVLPVKGWENETPSTGFITDFGGFRDSASSIMSRIGANIASNY